MAKMFYLASPIESRAKIQLTMADIFLIVHLKSRELPQSS